MNFFTSPMKAKLFTIPNLLTLANLLCGATGAVAALQWGDLTLAFVLMIAAAGFDFFDGLVARLLGQDGTLGVQLDSLADDISFGFLPAAVLFVLFGRMPGTWLPESAGVAVLLFAAFAALRLAKFNVDDSQHAEFFGLPSPAAALFCASLGLLSERCGLVLPREAVLLIALAVGVLMVSPVRMFALKFHGYGWKGNEVRYSFLVLGAGLLVALRWWAVPLIVALYVVVSTAMWIACRPENHRQTDK